jgi:transcriptional regulator with XRE-family HTH domain
MARNFKELEAQMPPERLARAETKARAILAEMFLAEIRKHAGFTQEELATALNIRQPSLSKLENQDDMQISTLKRIVEALGGKLELIAHLPQGDIRLSQFQRKTARPAS